MHSLDTILLVQEHDASVVKERPTALHVCKLEQYLLDVPGFRSATIIGKYLPQTLVQRLFDRLWFVNTISSTATVPYIIM